MSADGFVVPLVFVSLGFRIFIGSSEMRQCEQTHAQRVGGHTNKYKQIKQKNNGNIYSMYTLNNNKKNPIGNEMCSIYKCSCNRIRSFCVVLEWDELYGCVCNVDGLMLNWICVFFMNGLGSEINWREV